MKAIQASVIIPSYNGKDKVIGLLESIEKQSFSNIEVLVVIDGSTDSTAEKIRSVTWKISSLRLIEQENKGRAGARNAGAREAQTGLLIFFDDDMLLDRVCIEKHISANQLKLNRIVLGQVIEPSNEGDPEIKKYKDYLNTSWNKSLNAYRNKILPDSMVILSAANFSIPASLFHALGGFDESLQDIEDYDFALRAKAEKIDSYYLDEAIALHDDTFTFRKYADRSKAYVKNRILAASQKPDLYRNDPILTHTHRPILKCLYAFVKYPFWLTLLDAFNVFLLLPKKIRYKLYGIIITAFVHNQ